MNRLAVGIGGALGAVLRFLLGELTPPSMTFPFITLFINWSGSFVFAWLFVKLQSSKPWLKLGATTGFLGGFTTFSTFSMDTIHLMERHYVLAALYVLASLFGSILCCYAAYRLVQKGAKFTC